MAPGWISTKLAYLDHALVVNRIGLIVDTQAARATDTAEREAVLMLIRRVCRPGRLVALGADKLNDAASFTGALRARRIISHDRDQR